MNTAEKLEQWLRKVGYEGKIPANLRPFCNPRTALIWEQLIQSVKPRQEVEYIRNNILISRLLRNDQTCSGPGAYLLKQESRHSIPEIEVWTKQRKLKKHISTAHEGINEARSKLASQSTQNKMKYMNLENLKEKIRENRQCRFLLNAKAQKLEAETEAAEEMLTLARNLTPVESYEQNAAEVLETLKTCAKKLEQIIEKQNETQPAPSILNSHGFEFKTPRSKFRTKESFLSFGKTSSLLSSTKISTQHAKKSKPSLDDSMGLLEDLSGTFGNALAASSFKEPNFANGMCYDLPILNNQQLHESVEQLLHKYNRHLVWDLLCELSERCKAQLISTIIQNDENLSCLRMEEKDQVLAKSYSTHVDFKVRALQVKLRVKGLEKERRKLQDTVFAKLENKALSSSQLSDQKNLLELQQTEAGVAAALQYIDNAITSVQETTGNHNALQVAKEESLNAEKNIIAKLSCIEQKLNTFKQTFESMSQARSETALLTRKLGQFTQDCSWTNLLDTRVISTEIETFLDFPLEYNRKGPAQRFLRDLPLNHIPHQEDFDSNSILILVTLLQSPWSPAEALLADIVRAKRKVELLKAAKYVPGDVNINTYTSEELQSQDSYINYALDKLQSLIRGESTNRTTQTLGQVRETIRLWLEMPVKNFISPKKLLNGLPYEHYENLFESFYKQL